MRLQELKKNFDERRDIIIPGNEKETIDFCVDYFFWIAEESIKDHGFFAIALSGGNTPKAIYQEITSERHAKRVDWSKVLLFWSDERCVPPTHPDSNFKMAMDAGFAKVPIKPDQIFRMEAEKDFEEAALKYEEIIKKTLPSNSFDLILLGMGDDGHTASLFPKTHGLHAHSRLVIANYIPKLEAWRLTLTFECINAARHIAIVVMGKSKAAITQKSPQSFLQARPLSHSKNRHALA